MVSGSYHPGDVWWFEGTPDGFRAGQIITEPEGGMPERHSTSPYFADWDGDGDLDMVFGNILGEVGWAENIGSATEFKLGPRQPILLNGEPLVVEGRDARPEVVDWDGNTVSDLLVGCGDGAVLFFRGNLESRSTRIVLEVGPKYLVEPGRLGARAKLHAHDWDEDGHLDLLLGDFHGGGGNVWLLSRQVFPEEHRFEVIEEDGIPTAVSSGGPKYRMPLFEWELAAELRPDPDHPETSLNSIAGMAMDDEGFCYVANFGIQGRPAVILVYGPDGTFRRSFGFPKGEYGEFRLPQVRGYRDGLLQIFDIVTHRLMLFRPDGSLARTFNAPVSAREMQAFHATEEGTRILVVQDRNLEERAVRDRMRVLTFDPEGNEMGAMQTAEVVTQLRTGESSGVGSSGFFVPQACYDPQRGILLSTGVEPELVWYNLQGKPVKKIRIDLAREALTDADFGFILEKWPALSSVLKDPELIPGHHPYWNNILVDDLGYIWLECHLEIAKPADSGHTTFILLDPEGEFLGMARVPGHFMPERPGFAIMRGHVLTFLRDQETRQQYAAAYRLIPAAEGFRYPAPPARR